MIILVRPIPKSIPLHDNVYNFGTEWEVTVCEADNISAMIQWCHENYGDVKMEYYRHGWDVWSLVPTIDIIHYDQKANNINDSLRVRLKDEADVMGFKLKWLE